MKIDWTVKRNLIPGVGFYAKPKDQISSENILFKLTKNQKSVLSAYCQNIGKSFSEVIREALTLYFDQLDWVQPDQNNRDENQLKMF